MLRESSYRDLVAWQKAMDLATDVYRLSAEWPREERFALVLQVRRAAVAVPSNIAEGRGRTGSREFRHHLSIAHGSLCEVETQLLLGARLGFSPETAIRPLFERAQEVGRIIRGLMQSLG